MAFLTPLSFTRGGSKALLTSPSLSSSATHSRNPLFNSPQNPHSSKTIRASAAPDKPDPKLPQQLPPLPRRKPDTPGAADRSLFGIRLQTNGDVIKFGIAAVLAGYLFKSAVQFAGVPDLLAGQITTGVFGVVTLVGWVLTYVFRVGTKGMTYAQQLRDYEDEVIRKRYEELSEEELAALAEEIEDEE